MKIEKLNKDNIKEFIRDMALTDTKYLEDNISRLEYYGIKEDDVFCLGFKSLSSVDSIAILYYGNKLSNDKFYKYIDFLNKILVVDSHLIIEVYDEKYMNLLEEKYKCKEIIVTFGNSSDNLNNVSMKEKYADIKMKSIKYYSSKDMVTCNLIKQNIQDDDTILKLHEYFKSLDVMIINFIIRSDSFDFFKSLGYECVSKSYVIKSE